MPIISQNQYDILFSNDDQAFFLLVLLKLWSYFCLLVFPHHYQVVEEMHVHLLE
jgi:hypothetical protein